MASIPRAAKAIAAILVREGLAYAQSKAVFRAARQRAGLHATLERRGGVDRLTVEEELRFLDQAYAQGGRTGLMLQTLLETGARASELVQLKVEDVSLAERVITIRQRCPRTGRRDTSGWCATGADAMVARPSGRRCQSRRAASWPPSATAKPASRSPPHRQQRR
jgi:integrase